jgi:hypothetical protein
MSRICNLQRETGWQRLLRPWYYVRRKLRHMRVSASEKRKSGLRKRFCKPISLFFMTLCQLIFCWAPASYFLSEPAHKAISFPKVTPHAPNTKQTPARKDLTFFERVGQMLWAFGARLRENDLRYAIKAGMATAMLAAPAFFDNTRPIFMEYRGEWALISVSLLYQAFVALSQQQT